MNQFKLPTTKTCIVVWFRNGVRFQKLIQTPGNNNRLKDVMFAEEKVGMSEIRTVKSVEPTEFEFAPVWAKNKMNPAT